MCLKHGETVFHCLLELLDLGHGVAAGHTDAWGHRPSCHRGGIDLTLQLFQLCFELLLELLDDRVEGGGRLDTGDTCL